MHFKLSVSILLQLISIPVLNEILYAIARVFHEPYVPFNGVGMDFYPLTTIYLTIFILVSLPILNFISTFLIRNLIFEIIFHATWFGFILWATQGDLYYRPYEYGLVLLCIGSTIISRLIFNHLLMGKKKIIAIN